MLNNPLEQFRFEVSKRAEAYQKNDELQKAKQIFHNELLKIKYPYNFFWLGVPIIQTPQEIQGMQEIIWNVKPDLIIETGIAWGGSMIFSASMLAILESCGEIEDGKVIGVDIDIRSHNKKNILNHPLNEKIIMIEGSSIDGEIVKRITEKVRALGPNKKLKKQYN